MKGDAAEVPPPGAGFVTVIFILPAIATSLAGIVADSLVALTNVVACGLPLKFTTDFASKFAPSTVSVKAVPPAMCVASRLAIVGTGLLVEVTVNTLGPDWPTVGTGFVAVTLAVPAVAMSEAKIAAVICDVLTNVVALLVPLNCTLEPFTKPAPLSVSVNAAEPATAVEGDNELTVGAGLLIVNDAALDVPPEEGLVTATVAVPAVAISAAVIAAVNCVVLMNVVVLAAPLNFTTDGDTNPVPFTVRVKAAPPAVALAGEREITVGEGLLMVNV